MNALAYDLLVLTRRYREGAYKTQRNRSTTLLMCARQLGEAGHVQLRAWDFRGRHRNALVARWWAERISWKELCNRAAILRWWAEKIDNPGVIPMTNDFLRQETSRIPIGPQVSKAQVFDPACLAKITDPHIRVAIELAIVFGLRLHECLLVEPHRADEGTHLALVKTKGNRPRHVSITRDDQRLVLERAKTLVPRGQSMIPAGKEFHQQRNLLNRWLRKVGLRKLHGVRHHFAQEYFAEAAGHAAPVQGGPSRREMTPEERQADTQARTQLAQELGHNRPRISATYIG